MRHATTLRNDPIIRPKRGAKRKAMGISPHLSAAPAQRLTALVNPSLRALDLPPGVLDDAGRAVRLDGVVGVVVEDDVLLRRAVVEDAGALHDDAAEHLGVAVHLDEVAAAVVEVGGVDDAVELHGAAEIQ